MLIGYLLVSFVIGLFGAYICPTREWSGVIAKIAFTVYSLWGAILISGYAWGFFKHSIMQFF